MTRKRERARFPAKSGGEKMTKQSFRDEVDINSLVARYRQTGIMPHTRTRTPLYGDFSMAQDLQATLDTVRTTNESFMALPAAVREAANNSPVQLLEMLATDEGISQLEAQGLILSDDPDDLLPPDPDPAPTVPDDPPPS